MSYKISVIMPIYNAEDKLDKTIQSIINQSIGFENIELILVDDFSKDNSKDIIQQYSEKYDNIIPCLLTENHGCPSFGRNIGLEKATADFIMFIDNDDKYDVDICKNLYETITSEDADIVCCNKVYVDQISNINEQIGFLQGIEKNNKVYIYDDNLLFFDSITVWNKIYKKDLIEKNNLKFIDNTVGDDFAFTMDYYLNSNKLVYLKNYHGYYWNIRDDSLSHFKSEKYILDFINIYYYTLNQLKSKNKLHHVNNIFRTHLVHRIGDCTDLNLSFRETSKILSKFHDFEKEANFTGNLYVKWADFVNKCILREHYTTATLILKSIKKLRKLTFLRKLNRKINK